MVMEQVKSLLSFKLLYSDTMIMTRILDFGLLLTLLSCMTMTRIRPINAAVSLFASNGAMSRIQRRSTTRFSPQPHAQTAVLRFRGGDGGVHANANTNANVNANVTVVTTGKEQEQEHKHKHDMNTTTTTTTTAPETDTAPAPAPATETTATTELVYSLTGQDKVVMPAKTQDKAKKANAAVTSLEGAVKNDFDLPPAIVETTTTTIVEQSVFSQSTTNDTLITAESNVVDVESVVLDSKDDKVLEEQDKEDDKKSSCESAETMIQDEHIVEDMDTLIVKDEKVSANKLTAPAAPTAKPTLSVDETRERAAELRLKGKELHDAGDYIEAADCFGAAADLMHPYFVNHGHDNKDELDENDLFDLSENFCTLRLHEALCRLKSLDYEAAESACSQVLEGGDNNDNNDHNNKNNNIHLSSAVRARALFRRAKARIEMNMVEEAMQDARIAAFLGDRKAVALYGQLMRETSTSSIFSSSSSSPSPSLSSLSSLSSSSTADNSGGSLASSTSLLASLLDKSAGGGGSFPPGGFSPLSSSGNGAGMDLNPLSLLSMLQPQPDGSSGGGPMDGAGSLAKSVLTSLSKRLDDENTQESICNFLQQASGPQLQQYAIMAGVQLPASQANKIASFCQGITPRGLRRTVQNSKRLLYCIQLIRKTMAVLNKYKMIIFLIVLITWIKSAILRPIPINKRLARKAAQQAARAATAAI